MAVSSYSQDGAVQPPALISGTTDVGSTSPLQIQFSLAPAPALFVEETSGAAIALDSVTLMRDPFSVLTTYNFSSDRHTRVILSTRTNLA